MKLNVSRVILALALGAITSTGALAATVEVQAALAQTFTPMDVTIEVGDTVNWTMLTSTGPAHNVVEVDQTDYNSNTDNPNGGFNSGLAGAVPSFQFTFNTEGVFYYICQPHILTSMKGTVTVNATPAPSPTPIPTLTQWGLIAMTLLLFGVGAFILRRHGPSPA